MLGSPCWQRQAMDMKMGHAAMFSSYSSFCWTTGFHTHRPTSALCASSLALWCMSPHVLCAASQQKDTQEQKRRRRLAAEQEQRSKVLALSHPSQLVVAAGVTSCHVCTPLSAHMPVDVMVGSDTPLESMHVRCQPARTRCRMHSRACMTRCNCGSRHASRS